MDLLVASINAVVVAVVGGIVAWLGIGHFDAIDHNDRSARDTTSDDTRSTRSKVLLRR